MIVVKVWCLSPDQNEEDLNSLHRAIVKTAMSFPELSIKSEKDMVCLFPADLMKYGLGEEIIVEVSGLPDVAGASSKQLAKFIGQCVWTLYPKARVECSVSRYSPLRGFWTSTTFMTADC